MPVERVLFNSSKSVQWHLFPLSLFFSVFFPILNALSESLLNLIKLEQSQLKLALCMLYNSSEFLFLLMRTKQTSVRLSKWRHWALTKWPREEKPAKRGAFGSHLQVSSWESTRLSQLTARSCPSVDNKHAKSCTQLTVEPVGSGRVEETSQLKPRLLNSPSWMKRHLREEEEEERHLCRL